MTKNKPNILLVNPWIHDFAAYDFWAKPLGLLYIASILLKHRISVSYIDCLDRFHPMSQSTSRNEVSAGLRHGRGPYIKTEIPKPPGLENINRTYSRYGIKPEWFYNDLLKIASPDLRPDLKPDLIFVTSLMTYWYPGVQETIKILKQVFPQTPVVLGGIYASLCHEHAEKKSGADHVVAGQGENYIFNLVEEFTGVQIEPDSSFDNLDTYPYPAFHLQNTINYIPIMTSRGCPFKCVYCASSFLNKASMRRSPYSVVKEISHWHTEFKVKNYAFYDDALLTDSKNHIVPILEKIINSNMEIYFHTPNALHIREITKHIAVLMFKAGFKTIRLGLETTAFEDRKILDKKVNHEEFIQAVSYLLEAGFENNQIGAYLLAGMPEQNIDELINSIDTVKKTGIKPVLAYYTPIPHTKMWDKAVETSRYDLNADPVFTNNAIFPCQSENFSWETLSLLKNRISQ